MAYNLEDGAFYLEMLQMSTEQNKAAKLTNIMRNRQLEYAAKRKDENYIRIFHGASMQHYEKCLNLIRKHMETDDK